MNEASLPLLEDQFVAPACIRDIYSQSPCGVKPDQYCNIYPGVTFIRNRARLASGKGKVATPGVKKQIVTFSDKSRRDMMVSIAMLERPPRFWQDFTFADDVMVGKSIADRAKYSSICLKAFKQDIERAGFKAEGIWKREWKKRRSGKLQGQYVPHFHMVYTLPNRGDYEPVSRRLAEIWVKNTGTEEKEKALAVALHPKSSRFIESRKQMQKYMSKYMVKNEKNEMLITAESIGRNWGRLGSPKMAQGEVIEVSAREMVLFKRCLRKIARRARGLFREMLHRDRTKFFMMIEKETAIKYFEFIRVQENFEGVPF